MPHQRILLVDDHEVVRVGLRSLLERQPNFEVVAEAATAKDAVEKTAAYQPDVALLERQPNFEVVAEAATAKDAVEKTAAYQPDVVVMDIRLKGGSGIEACQEITTRFPQTRVIMLTSYAEDEMLFSAIRAGAAGYVLKQIGSEDLVRAIEAIGRGDALLDPAVTQRVFQEVRKAAREEEASAFADLFRRSARPPARRRPRRSPTSPNRRCMCCSSSPRVGRIVRSPRRSTWARALSATTSAASCRSSTCAIGPRPPPTPSNTI